MELLRDRNGRYVVTDDIERAVVLAVRSSGKSPAREFLEWLEHEDQRVLLKFLALFQKIASCGRITNKKQFRKEEDGIWSFKHGQYRIGCFLDERSWVLTHGFVKKRDKWPPTELRGAQEIMADDLARIRAARR